MGQAPITPEPRLKRRLSRTLVFTIIPIALLPILIVGSIAYFGARDLIRSQSFTQLESIENNLQSQINSWISEKHIFLYNTTRESELADSINRYYGSDRSLPDTQEIGRSIITDLNSANNQRQQPLFNYFVLAEADGTIRAASIQDWEGQTLEDPGLFEILSDKSVQSFLVYRLSPFQTSDIMIITAVPIFNENDALIGAVLAVSREDELRSFMQTAEIYPSSQSYFINDNLTFMGINIQMQNILRLEPAAEQNQVFSGYIEEGLANGEAFAQSRYLSFREEPVLGTFTWIPRLNSGFVVEVPTAEVYSRLNDLLPIAFGLLLGLIVVLAVLVQFFANRISKPIVEIADTAQEIARGGWQRRVEISRQDEIGLLAESFNSMTDQLSDLYRSLEDEVQERTDQIYAISDIEQRMSSAGNINDLFQFTTTAIQESFNYAHVSLYEVNPDGRYATLRSLSGERGDQMIPNRFTINTRIHMLINSALTSGEPTVTSAGDESPLFEHDRLPGTQSAAILPFYYQNEIIGFLSLQSKSPIAFGESAVTALNTIAKQLSITIQGLRSREATEINLEETSLLYRSSQRITQADQWSDVVNILVDTFQHISFISGLFRPEENGLVISSIIDPENQAVLSPPDALPVSVAQIQEALPGRESFLIIKDLDHPLGLPGQMMDFPRELGCRELVIFPIYQQRELTALILFGSREADRINPASIQPYANLVEMVSTTLEKLSAIQTVNQQLAELQTIQEIGRTVSQETDLHQLYRVVHEQVRRVMGPVDFQINLYDADREEILTPYQFVGDSLQPAPPPIPLGEGLISLLIQNGSPLMLVEETRERARGLGVKLNGDPPQSWLGVPLIVSGEAIGALSVQDFEKEKAFTPSDLEFLSTLSRQVGIAIRNTITLDETRERSLRQQQLFEASSKIRASTDIQSILETTAREISELLNAKRAKISLQPGSPSSPEPEEEEVQV